MMKPESEAPRSDVAWWILWCGPALVSVSFLALTVWTWRKWPDLLVDFGRELYVPWQLTMGKVLYVDIAYFNGPLSPYLNSLWFRLFGVSITTLIFVNLAILAAITCLIYTIFRDACDRITATSTSLTFICVFGFSQYTFVGNYNFVSPYSHEMTHGVGFTVGMIFLFSRYVRYRQLYVIMLAGLFLGLVFVTKAEVFLAAAAAAALGLGLLEVSSRSPGRRAGVASMAFVGATLLPIASFMAFLSIQMSATQALIGITGTWRALLTSSVATIPFYRVSMGLSDPGTNLLMMFRASAGIVLLAGAVAVADAARRLQKTRKTVAGLSALLFAVALLVKQVPAPGSLGRQWPVPWLLIGWPLPLFALGAGAALTVMCIKRRAEHQSSLRLLPLAMWAAMSFILLGKIILYPRLYHYGFALAMPATILLVALSVWLMPEVLRRFCGTGDFFRRIAVAMVLTDIMFYLFLSNMYYSRKDYVVGEDGDAIMTYGPQTDLAGIGTKRALERIQSLIPPKATFVALPEGVMLNYLSRRSNPTPYINFMPPEMSMFGEATILESFKAQPPNFILLVHKETSEYGFEYFGADASYGRQIMEWIDGHYMTEERILSEPLRDTRFGIKIMKRRS